MPHEHSSIDLAGAEPALPCPPTPADNAPAMPPALFAWMIAGSICFLAIGLNLAARQSAAYDEVTDVGAGYAFRHGNWRLDPEHLPLTKFIAALGLPYALPDLPLPAADPSPYERWNFGNRLLYQTHQQPLELLRSARTPLIWLNALLIPLLGFFTFRVAGSLAAAVAIGLASTEPLWIAHATLVGSDALPAVLLYASAFCAYALVHGSSRQRRAFAIGLTLSAGLCVAAKYYTPVGLACVWIAAGLDARRAGKLRELAPTLSISGFVAAVGGVCCAWGWPLDPSRYFYGLGQLGATHIHGYFFYAFGDFFRTRHRLYFVQALAVKASVGLLGLTALWLWLRLRRSARQDTTPLSTLLWLPALGHLVVLSLTVPPLGARYMLPMLPFLFMLAGLGAKALWERPRLHLVFPALACLQLWSIENAFTTSPISFFNGIGCYTGQTPPCLDDSNVDWGQALPALDEILKTRFSTAKLRVSYYGSSPVNAYLEHAETMAPDEWQKPQRALYAISLNNLARSSENSWARTTEPTLIVAGAYALYDLRDEPPAAQSLGALEKSR
jgi:hypothetical protein